ncbi:flap endonuclease 1 [Catenaria anguillulae PL171]|uniref:Flap endonuclease 1 n=1 Tax=Catenaria anguillulae PL171 TaxID=765915 RepID=A0A1Y2HL83_9FUNG|nr:flap endonuclease 1 [Catenaria anguillulae PL171]
MGIKGLTTVLGDHSPLSLKDNDIKNYFGRKVAIDASMSIYQFLIAVRSNGEQLANEAGETTSHLMGLFYRTIRMIENGIKPVYVFDGKPPTLKSGELAKRSEKRAEAEKNLTEAQEKGDTEQIEKFSRRTVKVTREHNDECKRLLRLMGVPYVEAPCEAEAQCAALAKAGKVYAAGTEDMDTLTFGSPIVLRHLTFSEARKMPISEIHLEKALEGLELTQDQFIDLCILLGCDYCESIKGIGPKSAVQLIKKHGSIEEVIKHLDKKYAVPEDWPFEEARRLFKEPEVADPEEVELKWSDPDEEGLVEFMVKEKGFNEERIRNAVKKIAKSKVGGTQGRLDSFFKVLPKTDQQKEVAAKKRKAEQEKAAAAKKAKTNAGKGKPRK